MGCTVPLLDDWATFTCGAVCCAGAWALKPGHTVNANPPNPIVTNLTLIRGASTSRALNFPKNKERMKRRLRPPAESVKNIGQQREERITRHRRPPSGFDPLPGER